MEQSEMSKRLAAAIDRFDEVMDALADNLQENVLPQFKVMSERLSKIGELWRFHE